MQKKIIAAAIIGMVSVGASAATVYDKDGLKVSLGGKFDFAVRYEDSEALQKVYLKDGAYSTSRLTLGASQAINADLEAYYSMDLRFNDIYTGKNPDTAGGLTSNDAKKGGLLSKKFGRLEAGVINVAVQQFSKAKKPYVNGQESELVKYGVSQMITALSNRTIYMHTTTSLPVILKGSYSISDNKATDSKSVANGKKGDMLAAGFETKFSLIDAGFGKVVKKSSSYAANNKIEHSEGFIAVTKDAAKLALHFSADKDHAAGTKGRGMSVNAYYLINKKIDLGAQYSKYSDRSDTATTGDSGHGYMLGVHYYAAKGVAFFAGTQFQNWDRADGKGKFAIIDGTKGNFLGSKSLKDTRIYDIGVNFAF